MEFTGKGGQVFPAGTTVKAYPRTNWAKSEVPPSGAPKGAAVAEAVVAADGSYAFSGLAEKTNYFAAAEVAGAYRYVRFSTVASSSNTRDASKTPGGVVEVLKEEATVVAVANSNRVSLTLTNDSENTIYVYKGAGAAVGKGIRLNKEGGAVIIDDYEGVVTAAAKTAKSNLCVSEV